jgi:hypothetical protein
LRLFLELCRLAVAGNRLRRDQPGWTQAVAALVGIGRLPIAWFSGRRRRRLSPVSAISLPAKGLPLSPTGQIHAPARFGSVAGAGISTAIASGECRRLRRRAAQI